MKNSRLMAVVLGAVIAVCPTFGKADEYSTKPERIALAVTNTNTAMIREERTVSLPAGNSTLRVSNISSYLVPESVSAQSKTAPKQFKVIRQKFVPGPVMQQEFLASLTGKTVLLKQSPESKPQQATLIAAVPSPVLSTKQGIVNADSSDQIIVPEGVSELMNKAGLVWECSNSFSADHTLEITYLSTHINWQADYVVNVDETALNADIAAWLTINNATDTDFEQARISIFTAPVENASAPLFKSNGMLKTLPAAVDLKRNSSIQINLFENSKKKLKINRLIVSDLPPVETSTVMLPAETIYSFKLENAGMLPPGDVRIMSKNNTPFFITVPLNIQDGTIEIPAGADPRIQVQRTVKVTQGTDTQAAQMAFDFILLNLGDKPLSVSLIQKTTSMTDVVNPGARFEKTSPDTVLFNLNLEPGSEQTLHYKLRLKAVG